MTLLKFKPRLTHSIPANFNSLVDELLMEKAVKNNAETKFVPRANILEKEKEFEIQLEVAGYSKKDIEINVENDVIKITGDNNVEQSTNSEKYHLRQIKEGKFSRSFYLPEDALEDKIVANFNNGILSVKIPIDETGPNKRSISIDD